MSNNRNIDKNIYLWNNIDKFIMVPTLLILLFGIISISSITQHLSGKFYFSSDLLLKKHLIFCIIGIVIMSLIPKLSLKNLIFFSFFLFALSIILSLTAIIFFPETKGANRWINFFNLSFQPSELLKPSFIVISAVLLGRYKSKNDSSFILNILLLILTSSLLIIQPDFGMFILIFAVWVIQVFSSNIKIKIIIPIILGFLFVFLLCFFSLEHVRFRIMNFLFSDIGDNYQISKSINSFIEGGLFGKGIGEGSVAKNLPDVHSDFIFALIGEEMGGFFALLILSLYFIVYMRAQIISQRSNNFFIVTALTGLSNILIFQVIINVSSSLNIIPTKGMTLPFISYGGSSFISSSIIIGFLLLLIKEEKHA